MIKEFLSVPSDADLESFYPLAQLKSDLVISSSHLENKLKRYRAAAVRISGQTARCVILPTDIRVRLEPPNYHSDCFGVCRGYKEGRDKSIKGIILPGPVISITSVTDGVTLLDSSRYRLANDMVQWMTADGLRTEERYASGELTILYRAGFSTNNPDRVSIRQAVFEIIAHWYSYPGEVNETSPLSLPQTASQILNSFWTSHTNRRTF